MPEYLAPGVFMEEVSYRSKSIEGVSTTTTGFVGPARFGPDSGVPLLVTSLAEYEASFGDDGDVSGQRNYLAFAVRAFFEQGGKRLYISRVTGTGVGPSTLKLTDAASPPTLSARYGGKYGDFVVRIRLDADPDSVRDGKATGLRPHDVVLVTPKDKSPDLREVEVLSSGGLQVNVGSPAADHPAFAPDAVAANTKVQLVTASLTVTQAGSSIFSAARLALSKKSSSASLERCLSPDSTGLSPITFPKAGRTSSRRSARTSSATRPRSR